MTTAFELDSYLLPLPNPTTPVVPAHLVTAMHAHLNTQYADPVWLLAPMTENPSASKLTINWANCPAVFQDELRLAVWNLINGQLRPAFLKERGSRMRSRLGADGTGEAVRRWVQLASWLEGRGISSLAECGPAVLHTYGLHLLETAGNRDSHQKILSSLTRLWAFDQLSARPKRHRTAALGRGGRRRLPASRDCPRWREHERSPGRGDDGSPTGLGYPHGRRPR